MKLFDFLSVFIQGLDKAGIAHCVLRNYDGLPHENPGNDIDILVSPNNIESALSILRGINHVIVTGILRRAYVVSTFISGIEWGHNRHAIEIDFVFLLGWKGIPYLPVNEVLYRAQYISNSDGLLKKPDACHEALISFLSSYLVGGWIKEKYQPLVQEIFRMDRQKIGLLLCDIMSQKTATVLAEAVINDDRKRVIGLLPKIKRHLLLTRLGSKPLHSLRAILTHFILELKIRITPYPIDTVCFLGPDGSGKSTVISEVIARLEGTTKEIACYHLKPNFTKQKGIPIPVIDPHAKPPRSMILSAGKIVYWLLLYWYNMIFHGYKNLTLRIWDRYYYDLLIDPKRYRYGAPIWFAKFIGKLMPKPDLFILLDAPPEVLQSRKREVSTEETSKQRTAYLQYIQKQKTAAIVDASQPLPQVFLDTNEVLLKFLAQRAASRL